MPNPQLSIDQIIAIGGGPTALAVALTRSGVPITHSAIVQWRAKGQVPLAKAAAVCRVTGLRWEQVVSPDQVVSPSSDLNRSKAA